MQPLVNLKMQMRIIQILCVGVDLRVNPLLLTYGQIHSFVLTNVHSYVGVASHAVRILKNISDSFRSYPCNLYHLL